MGPISPQKQWENSSWFHQLWVEARSPGQGSNPANKSHHSCQKETLADWLFPGMAAASWIADSSVIGSSLQLDPYVPFSQLHPYHLQSFIISKLYFLNVPYIKMKERKVQRKVQSQNHTFRKQKGKHNGIQVPVLSSGGRQVTLLFLPEKLAK